MTKVRILSVEDGYLKYCQRSLGLGKFLDEFITNFECGKNLVKEWR